ncbi:MAG: molybdopterin-binding oxidoreductase, partial [Actinoplanes sp.]
MNLSVRAGLSGVAAAAAALGVAEIIAVVTGPLSAPLLAVGGVVVDSVPGTVKNVAIEIFGVHDKTALITGTAILLGVYAYLVGLIALRSWPAALGGIGLFAVVGVTAALTRHDAGIQAALPSLIGAVVAVPVLRYLLTLARTGVAPPVRELATVGAPPPAVPEPTYGDGRRGFLKVAGIVVAVSAVGGLAGRLLTGRRAVNAARADVALPTPVGGAPVVPAGAQVQGAVPYVTPTDDFYRIDTALYPPQVDPSTWELRIHGMVR